MIRISVRSASPFARAGLERALAADPRFEIVAEHSSSYRIRGASGCDSSSMFRSRDVPTLPPTSVAGDSPPRFVLLTDAVTRTDLARLLPLGVRAILPRDSSPVEIAATLEAAQPTTSPSSLPIFLKLFCLQIPTFVSRSQIISWNRSPLARRRCWLFWRKEPATRRLRSG